MTFLWCRGQAGLGTLNRPPVQTTGLHGFMHHFQRRSCEKGCSHLNSSLMLLSSPTLYGKYNNYKEKHLTGCCSSAHKIAATQCKDIPKLRQHSQFQSSQEKHCCKAHLSWQQQDFSRRKIGEIIFLQSLGSELNTGFSKRSSYKLHCAKRVDSSFVSQEKRSMSREGLSKFEW